MLDEIGKNEDIKKNGMKIICDPYSKKINYLWRAAGSVDYGKLDSKASNLLNPKYTDTSIQNHASDILKEIAKTYNTGTEGLSISFVGTQADYDDFCEVLKAEYSESKIECIKDDFYYENAEDAFEKIKIQFAEIKEVLENNQGNEVIHDRIMKYEETMKTVVSLCVVGLYSSGKSAFINSLIGEELLPSGINPETAHVCKISHGDEYIIRFQFDGEKCELKFTGKEYYPGNNGELDIISRLEEVKEIDAYEIGHMNKALSILNKYNAKNEHHEMSDVIEVELPYDRSQLANGEYNFVIYDTPGSNSASHAEHSKILENSLDNQTNALPILIVKADTTDSKDNKELLSMINDMGSSLDKTNAIVVINQADSELMDELKKIDHDSLEITKWKSTGIFFLSAVMGIASKMDNPNDINTWIDKRMYKAYSKNTSDFGKSGNMQLHTLDKSGSALKKLDENAPYAACLYRNSGLESIENKIIEYARKYALYNKCQNASGYLREALEMCEKMVAEANTELQNTLKKARNSFKDQHKNLIDGLDEKKKELTAAYNKNFQEEMNRVYSECITKYNLNDKDIKKISFYNDINEKFKKMKKDAIKEEKEERKEKKKEIEKERELRNIENYVNNKYYNMLLEFSQEATDVSQKYWEEKTSDFKQECTNIIVNAKGMNDEQIRLLNSVIHIARSITEEKAVINLKEKGAIKKYHWIPLFRRNREHYLDVKKCCSVIRKEFEKAVYAKNNESVRINTDRFNRWAERLNHMLTKEICTFNSNLYHLKDEITSLENKLEEQEKCESKIRESSEFIKNLLEVHEVFDDEE